jgi:hypothetical protein
MLPLMGRSITGYNQVSSLFWTFVTFLNNALQKYLSFCYNVECE